MCPGTRHPEGTYGDGRHPDATRLDTHRLEVSWLDTLRLKRKYPGARRPDAKCRYTPCPDGRHIPWHSLYGRWGYTLTLIARKAETVPIFV
jgi:hypothetical protein